MKPTKVMTFGHKNALVEILGRTAWGSVRKGVIDVVLYQFF